MLPGSCCSWGLHALQLRALRASVAVCMPSMHQTLWTPVKMFAQHRAGGLGQLDAPKCQSAAGQTTISTFGIFCAIQVGPMAAGHKLSRPYPAMTAACSKESATRALFVQSMVASPVVFSHGSSSCEPAPPGWPFQQTLVQMLLSQPVQCSRMLSTATPAGAALMQLHSHMQLSMTDGSQSCSSNRTFSLLRARVPAAQQAAPSR